MPPLGEIAHPLLAKAAEHFADGQAGHERIRAIPRRAGTARLGAARVALLPPRGAADYGRSASRSAALAAIAYVPLGLGLTWPTWSSRLRRTAPRGYSPWAPTSSSR
jgi:hypothetical protein